MQQVKVLVVGAGGCGKTELVKSMKWSANNNYGFSDVYEPTIGVEVIPMRRDNIVFNFWDTAGQDKLGVMKEGYYPGSQIVIAAYDLTSNNSLKSISSQIAVVKQTLGDDIKIILVGCKADLYKGELPTSLLVTSAKTKLGLQSLIDKLIVNL